MKNRIEDERWRLQMTKMDMCKYLDVSLKTYNKYIQGGSIPSSVLTKLRELTGRSIDYLLGMDQQNEDPHSEEKAV